MQLEIAPVKTRPVVIANFDEVKEKVAESLAPFKGAEITESQSKDGKAMLAALRSDKRELNAKRIEIKKQIMEPYEEVEKKFKEIIALYDDAENVIKPQLEAFDNKFKEDRRQLYRDHYEGLFPVLALPLEGESVAILPFFKIEDDKWYNKTTNEKKVLDDISAIAGQLAGDWELVKTTCGPYVTECEQVLFDTRDLSETMRKFEALKANSERVRKLNETVAENKAASEPEEIIAQEFPGVEVTTETPAQAPQAAKEPREWAALEVCVSAGEKELLRQFLKSNNIENRKGVLKD